MTPLPVYTVLGFDWSIIRHDDSILYSQFFLAMELQLLGAGCLSDLGIKLLLVCLIVHTHSVLNSLSLILLSTVLTLLHMMCFVHRVLTKKGASAVCYVVHLYTLPTILFEVLLVWQSSDGIGDFTSPAIKLSSADLPF